MLPASTIPIPLISIGQAGQRARDDLLHLYQHGDPSTGTCGFHAFVRDAWRYVEAGEFTDNWHIESICRHFMSMVRGSALAPQEPRFTRLIIAMPPRHMKSLLSNVFFPAWVWLFWPGATFLHLSFKLDLSARDSRKFRRLIQSEWYESLADYGGLTKDTESRLENARGGHRIISSMENVTGAGGQYVIIDDPISAKKVHSPANRRSMIQSWKAVTSRRNDRWGAFVVIGQRTHEEDLTGYLLKEQPEKWEVLCLETIKEGKQQSTEGSLKLYRDPRQPEDVLWPSRFPRSMVDEMMDDLGPMEAAAQHQQRPVPLEGAIIKNGWWKFFRLHDVRDLDMLIASWDCAVKDGPENSYTVGAVIGRRGPDTFIFEVHRGHWDVFLTAREVEAQWERWPGCQSVVVEDKANGPTVIRILRERVPGIIPMNPKGSKEMRLRSFAAHVRSGNVYLLEDAPWLDEFMRELATFPRGANDDQVDAFTQGMAYLFENAQETHWG